MELLCLTHGHIEPTIKDGAIACPLCFPAVGGLEQFVKANANADELPDEAPADPFAEFGARLGAALVEGSSAYCEEHGLVEVAMEHGEPRCPHCGSALYAEPHEKVDAPPAEQPIVCPHCGAPLYNPPSGDDPSQPSPFMVCKEHGPVFQRVGDFFVPA